MCAHFIVIPRDELERMIADIRETLRAEKRDSIFASYEHAFPKKQVPVILDESRQQGDESKFLIRDMVWGYPVHWQKDVVFNTKMETALGSKPSMWDDSIKNRRCIIPTYGFFEPHMTDTHLSPKTGKPVKDKYFFHYPDSDVVWMAGVYQENNFSIMTTNPNQWISTIHRRMPVVLRSNELETWLYGDYPNLANRSEIELVSSKVA